MIPKEHTEKGFYPAYKDRSRLCTEKSKDKLSERTEGRIRSTNTMTHKYFLKRESPEFQAGSKRLKKCNKTRTILPWKFSTALHVTKRENGEATCQKQEGTELSWRLTKKSKKTRQHQTQTGEVKALHSYYWALTANPSLRELTNSSKPEPCAIGTLVLIAY